MFATAIHRIVLAAVHQLRGFPVRCVGECLAVREPKGDIVVLEHQRCGGSGRYIVKVEGYAIYIARHRHTHSLQLGCCVYELLLDVLVFGAVGRGVGIVTRCRRQRGSRSHLACLTAQGQIAQPYAVVSVERRRHIGVGRIKHVAGVIVPYRHNVLGRVRQRCRLAILRYHRFLHIRHTRGIERRGRHNTSVVKGVGVATVLCGIHFDIEQ